MKRFLRCFYLMFMLAQTAQAAPVQPEISWIHPDFPPYFIHNGPYAGQGTADRIEAFLARELPRFKHSQLRANLVRRDLEIKSDKLACSSAMLKTPAREQTMLFSNAYTSILPNGVIILRSKEARMLPYINARGELRLSQWLASAQYRLSAAAGRSFGPQIDAMLETDNQARHVFRFKSSDSFATGLLQMQNQQDVDGVLGYAVELSWTARRLGLQADAFKFLPIEGATRLQPSYIGCSKSPEAAEVLKHVNALIESGKLPELAKRAYVEWLPADAAGLFEILYKTERHQP